MIKDFVFHDLRHCVTNLADAGVDTETIMKIAGLATVKAERLDSAMARLDAAINTPVTPAKPQFAKALTK